MVCCKWYSRIVIAFEVDITKFATNVRRPTISLRIMSWPFTTSWIGGLLGTLGYLMHFTLVCQQSVPSVERLGTFTVTSLDFAVELVPLRIVRPCVPPMRIFSVECFSASKTFEGHLVMF
jgi:hypothetical protein